MPNQNTINERKLYQLVQVGLNKILRDNYKMLSDYFHIMRIESPSTPGVPDINVCVNSIEFWIECKVAPNKLGNYQVAWHKKRTLAGGRVFTLTWKPGIRLDEELKHILTDMIGEA